MLLDLRQACVVRAGLQPHARATSAGRTVGRAAAKSAGRRKACYNLLRCFDQQPVVDWPCTAPFRGLQAPSCLRVGRLGHEWRTDVGVDLDSLGRPDRAPECSSGADESVPHPFGLLLFGLLVTLLLVVLADTDRLRQARLVEVAVPLLFLTINAYVAVEWSLGPGNLTRLSDRQP
jgi:hypothetical protein